MTKKELYTVCHANGIPPLMYKWSFYEDMEEGWMRKKMLPIFEDIDSFIRGRNVWYFFLKDSVLASRIGATFFKAAILSDWSNVRYTTIENLAGYQLEGWYENGDVYTNILHADLVVVDKITHKMEDLQRKVWGRFVEDRLTLNKSTIFVGLVRFDREGVFDARGLSLLNDLSAKNITDDGIQPLC